LPAFITKGDVHERDKKSVLFVHQEAGKGDATFSHSNKSIGRKIMLRAILYRPGIVRRLTNKKGASAAF